MSEYKGLCPECGEEEIYSEVLTEGLCLNCYNRRQEERRFIEIECEHDWAEGYC